MRCTRTGAARTTCDSTGKGSISRPAPRDFSYAERGFEEAVALARKGDEWGRIALQRVVRNNLNPPQVEIARAVLDELDAVPAE